VTAQGGEVTTDTNKCDFCTELAEALEAAKRAEREANRLWKVACRVENHANMFLALHTRTDHPEIWGKRAAKSEAS